MPSIVFITQKQNKDPLKPNHVQEWVDFAGPQSDKGAFLISAFAAAPQVHNSQTPCVSRTSGLRPRAIDAATPHIGCTSR